MRECIVESNNIVFVVELTETSKVAGRFPDVVHVEVGHDVDGHGEN